MSEEDQNLKGTVFSPEKIIAYQKGSIVSKMIAYSKQGTITLFAFDADTGLSEHSAPYDAIIQVIEGTAEITLEEKTLRLSDKEMIILPAHIPHAVHATQKFKMILTMIHA